MNEAAERTQQCPTCDNEWDFDSQREADAAWDRWQKRLAVRRQEVIPLEALAAERRATVERIRAGLALHPAPDGTYGKAFVQGILDEEAAR